MASPFSIRLAQRDDIEALVAIELAAARLLEGHAPESVLAEATSRDAFERARLGQRLWVAAIGDRPVGFALVELLEDGLPHLDEIDVDPRHGRRGIGSALVRHVQQWALGNGHAEITLTTFRHVAWNMPFYARMGFEEIPATETSRSLRQVIEDETARGLDPATRVAMRFRA